VVRRGEKGNRSRVCWVSLKERDNLEDLSVDGSLSIVFCCVMRIANVTVMDANDKEAIFFS
jgi:hypothetical protein